MRSLGAKIKEKIREQNLSVHALEKNAGLKPSAVQNIIYGRSKNPSLFLIQAIANTLGCNLEDLLGEEIYEPVPKTTSQRTDPKENKEWNQELYLKCFEAVHSITNQRNIVVEKSKILNLVDAIYQYSLGNKSDLPDYYFANWLIDKDLNGGL